MVTEHISTAIAKSLMWLKSSLFFWLCSDPYYRMKPCNVMRGKPLKIKTLILVRHGESRWNYGFNNPLGFSIFRIFKMLISELQVFTKHDSAFLDSPLSLLGVNQAMGLRTYLGKTRGSQDMYVNILKGDHVEKTKIITSNLRRAITTTIIALYDRLEKSSEKLHTMSELQEITRNVDSFCITPIGSSPMPSQLEQTLKQKIGVDMARFLGRRIEASGHIGTKGIFSNGEIRINKFIKSIFACNQEYFIIGGHSLYFKEIFKGYLPKESKHEGKKAKMLNGAAVGLQIGEFKNQDGKIVHQIIENSVRVVHLGFVKKKAKKKLVALDTIFFAAVSLILLWRRYFSGSENNIGTE